MEHQTFWNKGALEGSQRACVKAFFYLVRNGDDCERLPEQPGTGERQVFGAEAGRSPRHHAGVVSLDEKE